jgi:hypothetical protein
MALIYEIHIYTKDIHFRNGLLNSINNIHLKGVRVKLLNEQPDYMIIHQGNHVILLVDDNDPIEISGYQHVIYLVNSVNSKMRGIYKFQRIESIIHEALDCIGISLEGDLPKGTCRIIAVASFFGGVGKSKLIGGIMNLLSQPDKRCALRLNNVLQKDLCVSDVLWDVKWKHKNGTGNLRRCHYVSHSNQNEIGSFKGVEDYQNQRPLELLDALREYGEFFGLRTIFLECMNSLDKLHEGIFKHADSIILLDDLSQSRDTLAKEVYTLWTDNHPDVRLVSTASRAGDYSSMLPYDDGSNNYNTAIQTYIISGGAYDE